MARYLREPTGSYDPAEIVVYQGHTGAYAHLACRHIFPDRPALAAPSFRDALRAVSAGEGSRAVIPIENTLAGRVADIHDLIPHTDLHIVGEHFQFVDHKLLGLPGARRERLHTIRSHIHALAQCDQLVTTLNAGTVVHYDTAGAARTVAQSDDWGEAAIGSELAAEHYGLEILQHSVQDGARNVTRFAVFARSASQHDPRETPSVTSLIMKLQSQPAALFKALGSFATNFIEVTKLESYLVGTGFHYAQFFLEVRGHPQEPNMDRALRELASHTEWYRLLGAYPADAERLKRAPAIPEPVRDAARVSEEGTSGYAGWT